MDSNLSDEEFQRLQTQLLELKTNNYSLEEQKRRNVSEIQTLKQRTEELEKQLSRAQTVNKINPLSLARNIANKVDNKFRDKGIDQLVAENDNLIRKIESQEQEFRVTNDTLKSEIQTLIVTNDRLEEELKILRDNELHPECDLGINSTAIGVNCETNSMASNISADQQNPLSFAILAEKEKLELKVYDLQELSESLRKENQLIAAKVKELSAKCVERDGLERELSDRNKLIERQNGLIEEMRSHKLEIDHKFRSDLEKLKAEHKSKVDVLESKLKSTHETNERLEKKVKELMTKLNELEDIRKQNDKLVNELHSYKEELSFCRTQTEETVERLKNEFQQNCDQLSAKHDTEVEDFTQECDDYRHRINGLETEIKALNQRILDDIEDRKIHEKKGVLMVKELKRQLHSERKRADKLQERLNELLNESTASISSDIQRKQSMNCNTNNGNDSSSVGSWSFMSAKDNTHNRTSSIHSATSDGRESTTSPVSPIATNDNPVVERNAFLLEKENNELVSRITALQQEKWVLEERINQLELSNSALTEDMSRKTDLIQYYSMEGRPDSHSSQQLMLQNSDKLTVKRLVDFIKDKGDENMREINRKVQRMLEETLTKNMYLHQNLDSLSKEVQRLNKIVENNPNSELSIHSND